MSGVATLMNFYSAVTTRTAPSQSALIGVTVGFWVLLVALLIVTRSQPKRGRVLSVVAMSVFAVSALHLSSPEISEDPWWLQLAAALFVDKIVLRRGDYAELTSMLSAAIDRCETPEAVLDETTRILAPALSATSIEWLECDQNNHSIVQPDRHSAHITVPTT